jgi:hypothetical protein
MTEAGLYDFMAKHRLGVLGTICDRGTPQSALVGIAITPRLEIIFDTLKSSRKYSNLVSRPPCSFVIGGWGAGEQTVQFEGEAKEPGTISSDLFQRLARRSCADGLAGDRLLCCAADLASLQRLRSKSAINTRVSISNRAAK